MCISHRECDPHGRVGGEKAALEEAAGEKDIRTLGTGRLAATRASLPGKPSKSTPSQPSHKPVYCQLPNCRLYSQNPLASLRRAVGGL